MFNASSLSGLAFGVSCAVLLPFSGLAQTGSTLNCGAANGVAEAMICSDPGLGASDGRVAGRFETALSALEAEGDESADALAQLRETQDAWSEARDNCRAARDPRSCLSDAYAMREAELVAAFDLEAPAQTVSYDCRSAGAGEISIAFYDLETPSVRIEAGDDIAAGTSMVTPDGAKYRLNTGQELWLRKDVARFTAPGRGSQTCEIVQR